VLVVDATTSFKFVTKYEYDSIRSMYDYDSAVGSLVNVVTQGEYNDWKRSQAIAAFNLFGQPAMQPLAPLSLISGDVQSAINDIHSSMTAMGLTDSMQLSAMSSLGSTSSLPYEMAAANSASQAWQSPLGGINGYSAPYNPWNVDRAIEDYNANLITSMPADFESNMAAAVNSFWSGYSFDTGIGTVNIGGSTGSNNGSNLGYNPPPTIGPSISCPIGIDLGNGTPGLAQDARFSEFRVWQDQNQDGVSDAGELKTLEGATGLGYCRAA